MPKLKTQAAHSYQKQNDGTDLNDTTKKNCRLNNTIPPPRANVNSGAEKLDSFP